MVFKTDKLICIISEILSFIIKGIAILDNFLYSKELKTLPQIEKDKTYGEIEGNLYYYEELINNGNLSGICLIMLIIEFILFLIFLCINKNNEIESSKDSKIQSIIFYTIFGVLLFIMLNFYEMNIVDCNTKYIYNFNSNYFEINRTYTIINNTKIYLSPNRNEHYYEELYTIFIYYYNDYPILEKIYKIHEKNSKKIFQNQQLANIDSNVYLIFRLGFSPFFTLITGVFIFIYKYKNKCKTFYYIFYICLLLINLINIILPTIIVKSYGYEQNLKNEDENIKFILDDYNQYAKCINKFPLAKIIEIMFLIILISILVIFDMKLFKYCNRKVKQIKIIPEYIHKDKEKKLTVRFREECFLGTVEITASSNQKFKVVLNNLILKFKILQKYKIKYVKYSKKLIYSEFLQKNKKLEEINYKEGTEFEIILKKEKELLLKFKSKFLKNKDEFKVEVSYIDKFKNVIELLKDNYNELNNTMMDNIICYQHYNNKDYIIINGKIDYEKYIKDLNINKNEIIFFEPKNKLILHSKNAKKALEKQIEMQFVHKGIGTDEMYTIEIFKKNTF